MREFVSSVRIDCRPEAAFDFVADHRNVALVLEGISRWEPVDPDLVGMVGARYDVEMRTFGLPLHNILELDRWDRPRRIGWHSVSGLIEQRGAWTFAGNRDRTTTVTLKIAYQPPGAAIGNLLAAQADRAVRQRLERALSSMRQRLEG